MSTFVHFFTPNERHISQITAYKLAAGRLLMSDHNKCLHHSFSQFHSYEKHCCRNYTSLTMHHVLVLYRKFHQFKRLHILTMTEFTESAISYRMTNRQSMSSACPALPIVAINWSMMPQGMLAYTCSARWQQRALVISLITGDWAAVLLTSASSRVNIATSSDAELDSPPPTGTDVTMTTSKEGKRSTHHKISHINFSCWSLLQVSWQIINFQKLSHENVTINTITAYNSLCELTKTA